MFGPKHVWGLDIGRFGLKAVKVAKAGDQLRLLDADMIEYDWGSVGEGVSNQAMLDAIQEFTSKHTIGKKDRIFVSMPGRSVFTRFINLPPVEKKRVPEIVKYEARQQIPFSIEEVVWAYQPVKEEHLPGEEIEIGLFAIKQEIVQDFLANLMALKENLYGLQIAPLAMYNFVRYDVQPAEPVVVVDVGADNTDLVIIDGPKFWTRNLPVAGNSITEAIRDKFDISFEEAENVKRMAAQSKHARQVFEVMEPVLRDLVSEIQRTIGYYKSLAKEVKFAEVLVLGNAFKLPGMEKFLSDNLQYKVRALDKVNRFELADGLDQAAFQEHVLTYAPALGLAVQALGLGHMKTNLLPVEYEEARELGRKKPLSAAAAACLLVAVACGYVREKSLQKLLREYENKGQSIVDKVERLDREYKSARAAVEQAKGPAVQMSSVGKLPDLGYERSFWMTFFQKFFDEKEGCVPKGAYLKYFIIQRGRTAGMSAIDAMSRGNRGRGDRSLTATLEGTCAENDEYIQKNILEKIQRFKPDPKFKSPVTRDAQFLEDTPQPVTVKLSSGETEQRLRFIISFKFKKYDEAMIPDETEKSSK